MADRDRPVTAPRVLIVGAGAIGGAVAAGLVRAGHRPTVVDLDAEQVARLRDPGLVVDRSASATGEHGGRGEGPLPLDARLPDEASDETVDVLLLAVRSQHTEPALRPFVGRLAADGDVVSLQNGLNEETIADLVGPARTVGCVVGFGATWLGPGHVEVTSGGDLALGRLDGSHDVGLERAHTVLADAFPARLTDDVTAERWTKLLINTVTVLGAVGGVLTGQLLTEPRHRIAVHGVVAEVTDVALAEGVALRDVLGLDPRAVVERRPGWTDELDAVLDRLVPYVRDVKSVTWRDLELGRPTEVDAVTGEVVTRGRRAGLSVPVNEAAYALLRELEAGRRRPDPTNLDELAAAAAAGR